MLDRSNTEVLRRLITGLSLQDSALIADALTDDIVWHVGGRGALAGDYKGIPSVMALISSLLRFASEDFRISVHDMLANDQHGILLLREAATRGGDTLEYQVMDVHHFRDGKVCEVWSVASDQTAVDQFFSQAG